MVSPEKNDRMNSVIYCGNCGQSSPSSNKFCGKCGHPLSLPAAQPQSASQQQPSLNACPHCHGLDQIRKLSAIVSSETLTTSGVSATSTEAKIAGDHQYYSRTSDYVGRGESAGKIHTSSVTSINTVEASDLAKKVARPPRPSDPALPGSSVPEWFLVVSMVISGIIAYLSVEATYSLHKSVLLGFVIGIVVFGVFVMLVAFLGGKAGFDERYKKSQVEYEVQKRQFARAIAEWEEANKRWEKMYYCYRDDVIFVPGEELTARPSDTTRFCYGRT